MKEKEKEEEKEEEEKEKEEEKEDEKDGVIGTGWKGKEESERKYSFPRA